MSPVKYSIRDLERLTGVKTHTIRIWEKRYGIIQPDRTDTNIRYYSDSHLQKLLNICILNQNGHKISLISEMSDEEIIAEVSKLSDSESLVDVDINSMVLAAIEMHEEQFDRVLNSCLLKFGFEETFCQVIFPLFEKLAIMWQIGRISACQERFITNLVRQKLHVATDGLVGGIDDSRGSFLMFMPVGHESEIGLLYANYLLRKNNYQVVYLGPSVPFEHLQSLGSPEKFEHLLITFSLPVSTEEMQEYISKLKTVFTQHQIHVIAPKGQAVINNSDNLHVYLDYEQFSSKIVK